MSQLSHLAITARRHERADVLSIRDTSTSPVTASITFPNKTAAFLAASMAALKGELETLSEFAAKLLEIHTRQGFESAFDPVKHLKGVAQKSRKLRDTAVGEITDIATSDSNLNTPHWGANEPDAAARGALLARLLDLPVSARIQAILGSETQTKVAISAGQTAIGLDDANWGMTLQTMRLINAKRFTASQGTVKAVPTLANPLANGPDAQAHEGAAQALLDDLDARREDVKSAENVLRQTVYFVAMMFNVKPDVAFGWLNS